MNRQSLAYFILIFAAAAFAVSAAGSKTVKPRGPGWRITESVQIAPGVYEIPDVKDEGTIAILGDNLTVDFTGVTLVGSSEGTTPDAFMGRGIVIRGQNVTVKNATVRGYKVGIYAEESDHLTITGCDVSGNFRQRLKSTPQREDLSDWLYGHENDQNEWLRYGAGIYLFKCPNAKVVNNFARNGQNGICLCRCDAARVADNDMSFMSGWGLAMWRSSRGEIFNNKFDWCMRGYSHGIYARGQDSAGILVYEQCNDNLFAYNSATHGGDGFFLYAGNETLHQTGRGGCNGNIVYQNDFSHAAANGIEATFSTGNLFIKNILRECTHGVWAGYSYNTVVEGNVIARCKYGVSIEHGHHNLIGGNTMADTELGVHLWWDDDHDLLASPFGKARNGCRSYDNTVVANRFDRVKTAIRLADDTGSAVSRNVMTGVDASVHLVGRVDGVRLELGATDRAAVRQETDALVEFVIEDPAAPRWTPRNIRGEEPRLVSCRGLQDAFLPQGARRGREYIFVDEWGPYDFSDVRLFPKRVVGGRRAVLQLLGPKPFEFAVDVTGDVKVSPAHGRLPVKLTVEATKHGAHQFALECQADGSKVRAAGLLLNTDWRVQFFGWDGDSDPRDGDEAWRRIVAGKPLAEMIAEAVDFVWYHRSPAEEVPSDRFATVATTAVNLAAGTWKVQTISDDGVRVIVDERRIINNWTHHAPTKDDAEIELTAGQHAFRVEHFEIDGYAQLQFLLEPMGER